MLFTNISLRVKAYLQRATPRERFPGSNILTRIYKLKYIDSRFLLLAHLSSTQNHEDGVFGHHHVVGKSNIQKFKKAREKPSKNNIRDFPCWNEPHP